MKLNYLANCVEEIIKTCEGELDIKHYRAVENVITMSIKWITIH